MRAIFPDRMEEELKAAFFAATPKGFFVDVGANAPREGSQSWQLEQSGWTGVLVEPQPDLADALKRERTAKVYAVACSRPGNAGKTLTLYLAGIQSSLVADFYVAGVRREGTIAVPVTTLDQVLADAGAPSPLDFVSIDVEGHAIEVLDGFTLARWQPRLLLIEDIVQDLSLHRALTRQGYRWFRRTGINSWYVPAGAQERIGLLGRLQFLRKYYLGRPFRVLRDAKRRLLKQ
jgi:FkbM family methyltransferase